MEEERRGKMAVDPSSWKTTTEGPHNGWLWIPKLLLALLVIVIAYVYFSPESLPELTPEEARRKAEEARQKRLARLEQQQQQQQGETESTSADKDDLKKKEKKSTIKKQQAVLKKPPPLLAEKTTSTKKEEPKRPVESNKGKESDSTEQKKNDNTASPLPAAVVDAVKSKEPEIATSVEGNATPTAPKRAPKRLTMKTPREILIHSLSSITGMTIILADKEEKKASSSSTNKSTIVILSGVSPLQKLESSWDEILEATDSIWAKLRPPLFASLQPPKVKTSYYQPTKLSDGTLWKASVWYHISKTWVADHKASLDETAQTQLSRVLETFQEWIVDQLAQRLQQDIAVLPSPCNSDGKNTTHDNEEEEEDLGLFADESYGGTSTTTAATATATKEKHPTTRTLFQELLTLLEDASSCPRILTKPFLTRLVQTYDSKSNSSSSLGSILLRQCLGRLPEPEQTTAMEWETTQHQITALVNLLTLSPDAANALLELPPTQSALNTTNSSIMDGKEMETACVTRSLWCLAAFTVPRFSTTTRQTSRNNAPYNDLLPPSFHASMCDSVGREYPVCLYARRGYETSLASYHGTVKHSRAIMKAARSTGVLVMKRMAATTKNGGPNNNQQNGLFEWIRSLLEANEPLVDMLQSDLLSPDSAQALCASRPFLLGITSSMLQMCTANLSTRLLDKSGGAFDSHYLRKEGEQEKDMDKKVPGLVISSKERSLINQPMNSTTMNDSKEDAPSRFSGATEFFFLTAALLRICLFPGFRVNEEFQSMLRNVFASLQQLAGQQPTAEQLRGIRGDVIDQYQKCSSVTQGWSALVDDPEISSLITSFSLLQLQWVAMVATSTATTSEDSDALTRIPEWFVKLPAQWLAHVAMYTPSLIRPHQGEAAVKHATQILQAGTTKSSSSSRLQKSFSPPVLCQLIRIAGAFVREGVRRARAREKGKAHHRGRSFRNHRDRSRNKTGGEEEEEDFELDLIDDRTLDIYHSFDARDLGVTVLTNHFVATQLCPTLMRAYMAMDAAEGMDVEREHHFEKFEVKHEVADLFLRLWCHPNGESRDYIVQDLDVVAMNEFCASIAGALGFQMDQTCQFILDIRDIKSAHEDRFRTLRIRVPEVPPLSPRDEASVDHHAKFLSFSTFQCRRLLLILCRFSKEANIAATLGGTPGPSKKGFIGKSAASDLASMFVNLMDRLTAEDGGIHPELETRQLSSGERSAEVLHRLDQIPPDDLKKKLHYFLHARRFLLLEYGLDVSILIHQLLALAARWHLAASSIGKDGKRTSKFLSAAAANDLCNVKQLRNVCKRLIGTSQEMTGSEADNAAYILGRDGHVDISIWKSSYKIVGSGPDKGRNRKNTAKQDRMSHEELDDVADVKDIEAFLDDLENAVANKAKTVVAAAWGEESMQKLESTLLTQGESLADESYTEQLGEWVVSSESFLSKAGNGSFAHSYDSIVRGRSVEAIGSGKVLVKEARKCVRLLPAPHPNTSTFVCFAEERMDLCKAIITGAADTPFALGMFEFDVLFPTNYPSSPPLLNFRTTGDGQTRISSNLYNDGKVCISILGTYQAWDDSQRWNPATSSLAQVLASIQTQLLGDAEPYFSDGFNHDAQRGTPAGEVGSRRFNNKIRLHTLRHAMIAHLRHPPLGFEEVTKRHFALCRKRILVQARRWTLEAQGTPLFKNFVRAYEEIATLLSSDAIVKHKLPGQADGDIISPWGAVPLDSADVRALEASDAAFVESHLTTLDPLVEAESSQPEDTVGGDNVDVGMTVTEGGNVDSNISGADGGSISEPGYNPWAVGGQQVVLPSQNQPATQDDDDLDDMYL